MADRYGGSAITMLPGTFPTFYAVFDRIQVQSTKYMATLFNTSATRVVRITHIWRFEWQVTAVTGAFKTQDVLRITARTPGTPVTIRADDPSDTLSAGITADTDSTVVTVDHTILRIAAVTEEMVLAATGLQLLMSTDDHGQLIYAEDKGQRGILLRENEGVTIFNVSTGATGTVSYIMEFFDLPA